MTDLAWTAEGEGHPVALIHAGIADAWMWADQSDRPVTVRQSPNRRLRLV